jgi:hypothetical protein
MIIAASLVPAGNPTGPLLRNRRRYSLPRRLSSTKNRLPHVAPAVSPWRRSQDLHGQFRFATKQQPQRRLPRLLNCSIPRGNIGSLLIAAKRPKISGALNNNQRPGALMEIPVGRLLNLPDIQVRNVEITEREIRRDIESTRGYSIRRRCGQ